MKKAYLFTGKSKTVYLYIPNGSGQNAPLLLLEALSLWSCKINEVCNKETHLRIHINEDIQVLQDIKLYINKNL